MNNDLFGMSPAQVSAPTVFKSAAEFKLHMPNSVLKSDAFKDAFNHMEAFNKARTFVVAFVWSDHAWIVCYDDTTNEDIQIPPGRVNSFYHAAHAGNTFVHVEGRPRRTFSCSNTGI